MSKGIRRGIAAHMRSGILPTSTAGKHRLVLPQRGQTMNAPSNKEAIMSVSMILVILLILLLVGALPSWGYSRNWGYGPSGGLGLLVLILVVLLLMGRI